MTATANLLNGAAPTASTTLSPAAAWKATLDEIKPQLTKATYDQQLSDATLLRIEGDHFVIGARNAYAADWLNNRLRDTILRTMNGILDRPATIEFVPMETVHPPARKKFAILQQQEPAPEPEQPVEEAVYVEPFVGFDTPESNWTTTPDSFFTHLARYEDGVITKLVAQVIYHTWGQFEDKRRQLRVWEWPVTMGVLLEMCGIKSRTSLYTAIWDARDKGYVIMRPLTDPEEIARFQARYGYKPSFTLRLKQRDDGLDTPSTQRPAYGSKSVQ